MCISEYFVIVHIGWDEQLKLMSERNDNNLEIPDFFEEEIGEEWSLLN